MITSLLNKLNSRIAHKLALWVIIFSTLFSLIATAIQLYLDYRQDLKSIESYFDSISFMQLNSISQSVWIMDDQQIQAQLNGITKGRDIIYAAVITNNRPQWVSGVNNAKRTLGLTYELVYSHRESSFNLGNLEVVASLDNLYRRLMWRALVILLTNILKTFLFAGCILLFFQHAVTKHLEKLASHVVNMDFRSKLAPLKLERESSSPEDEFSQVVNMLNIFQRRGYHAFNAMEKSELRLRLFFDATEEGIFGINSEGRITFANSACLQKIGISDSQGLIGEKVEKVFNYEIRDAESHENITNLFLDPMLSGQSASSDDGFFRVHGGSSFFASVRTYPIVADGVTTGAVIFFNDISEQREMLKEKNLLSQAVRQSPLMIIISDAIGYIEYVNPSFEKLTGYSLQEVMGKHPFFLGSYKKNKSTRKTIKKSLLAGNEWQGLYQVRAKDGTEYTFDSLISPVFNERGKIINIIALCLDITQKVELQNQLNHAQKMDAVGRLSASFAHEFGNPLLGVRSVIRDISERVPMEKSDQQLLNLAYDECERMKVLIRDFQRFQRSSSGTKENHDIHQILDNVLFFYKRHFEKKNIVLKKKYHNHVPLLYLSKDQIAQVFLNLIMNAVDSMVGVGGILEIATSVTDDDVIIDVKDTGSGIDDVDRDLIFEPFYTTKQEVQGTGLGLSVSYGIVAGHGGDITVSSTSSEGSIFTVRLPLKALQN